MKAEVIIDGVGYIRVGEPELSKRVSPENMARLSKAWEGLMRYQMSEADYLKFRDSIPGTLQKIDTND